MNLPLLRSPEWHRGAIGIAAIGAVILLAVFYSVVAGAVSRADAERRAAIQLQAAARAAADARFAARPVFAVQAPPRTPQRYVPRTVAFRSAN